MIGVAFIIAYILIIKNIEHKYGVQLEMLSDELRANQRYVYEALIDIEAGTIIQSENLEYKMVYTSQKGNTFIQKYDIGKVALISIPCGTYVQKSMVEENEIKSDLREVDYSCIQISDAVDIYDTIDVRIVYPNGENYIILAKKSVKNWVEEIQSCYLWLNEEEILLMSSAIVDAYLYPGAYLYSTKYIEPSIQKAAVVNYQPSVASLNLVQHNPNIVEIAAKELNQKLRIEMENRLRLQADYEANGSKEKIEQNLGVENIEESTANIVEKEDFVSVNAGQEEDKTNNSRQEEVYYEYGN